MLRTALSRRIAQSQCIRLPEIICKELASSTQITARVDADVLEWLKSQRKGYQSRINAILRQEIRGRMRRNNHYQVGSTEIDEVNLL